VNVLISELHARGGRQAVRAVRLEPVKNAPPGCKALRRKRTPTSACCSAPPIKSVTPGRDARQLAVKEIGVRP
jgi:hypothetical protein